MSMVSNTPNLDSGIKIRSSANLEAVENIKSAVRISTLTDSIFSQMRMKVLTLRGKYVKLETENGEPVYVKVRDLAKKMEITKKEEKKQLIQSLSGMRYEVLFHALEIEHALQSKSGSEKKLPFSLSLEVLQNINAVFKARTGPSWTMLGEGPRLVLLEEKTPENSEGMQSGSAIHEEELPSNPASPVPKGIAKKTVTVISDRGTREEYAHIGSGGTADVYRRTDRAYKIANQQNIVHNPDCIAQTQKDMQKEAEILGKIHQDKNEVGIQESPKLHSVYVLYTTPDATDISVSGSAFFVQDSKFYAGGDLKKKLENLRGSGLDPLASSDSRLEKNTEELNKVSDCLENVNKKISEQMEIGEQEHKIRKKIESIFDSEPVKAEKKITTLSKIYSFFGGRVSCDSKEEKEDLNKTPNLSDQYKFFNKNVSSVSTKKRDKLEALIKDGEEQLSNLADRERDDLTELRKDSVIQTLERETGIEFSCLVDMQSILSKKKSSLLKENEEIKNKLYFIKNKDNLISIQNNLSKGYAALERHNVVHLDGREDNYYLDEDGTAVIGDFGCALDVSDSGLSSLPQEFFGSDAVSVDDQLLYQNFEREDEKNFRKFLFSLDRYQFGDVCARMAGIDCREVTPEILQNKLVAAYGQERGECIAKMLSSDWKDRPSAAEVEGIFCSEPISEDAN